MFLLAWTGEVWLIHVFLCFIIFSLATDFARSMIRFTWYSLTILLLGTRKKCEALLDNALRPKNQLNEDESRTFTQNTTNCRRGRTARVSKMYVSKNVTPKNYKQKKLTSKTLVTLLRPFWLVLSSSTNIVLESSPKCSFQRSWKWLHLARQL